MPVCLHPSYVQLLAIPAGWGNQKTPLVPYRGHLGGLKPKSPLGHVKNKSCGASWIFCIRHRTLNKIFVHVIWQTHLYQWPTFQRKMKTSFYALGILWIALSWENFVMTSANNHAILKYWRLSFKVMRKNLLQVLFSPPIC